MMRLSRPWSFVLSVALAAPMLLTGCASTSERADRPEGVPVLLDGVIEEWPDGAAAIADPSYLYFRMSVRGEQFAPQASDRSLALWLDVDDDATTGAAVERPEGSLGVDLKITWSPPISAGGKGRGVAVEAVSAEGKLTTINRASTDLSIMPTYASRWYEGRLSRTFAAPGLPTQGLLSSGSVRGVFVLSDADGKSARWSDPFTVIVPEAEARTPSDNAIPAPRGVRVMSFNVLKNSPEKNPEPFARVLRSLRPDVALIAEWDNTPAERIRDWFVANVDASVDWQCVADPRGVAIVSRHPLNPLPLGTLALPPGENGKPMTVRAIGAVAFTPAGSVAAVAVHLKCCGSAAGPEDRRRIEESRLINAGLRSALGTIKPPAFIVIGGDMNLVGSRPPLDLLRAGLDANEQDLSVADPLVLGDAAMYTWTDPASEFGPGRLDYLLYNASRSRMLDAFVLDTSRLSADSLDRAGLKPEDSAASDHLPVVLDLEAR